MEERGKSGDMIMMCKYITKTEEIDRNNCITLVAGIKNSESKLFKDIVKENI